MSSLDLWSGWRCYVQAQAKAIALFSERLKTPRSPVSANLIGDFSFGGAMQQDEKPKTIRERLRVILLWYILPAILLGTLVKFIGSGIIISILLAAITVFGFSALMLYAYRNEISEVYKRLPLPVRMGIWGFALWCFLVFSFVLIFEPFGYMYEKDWYTVWKIAIFPPLFIALGYVSYLKMVRGSRHKI